MSREREEAELLLRRAAEDEAVVVALAENREIADSVLGFHAQQAVEKALKAVIASRGEDFPWTHDLQLLLRRVEQAGVEPNETVRGARRLSPWAVEFRYDVTIDVSCTTCRMRANAVSSPHGCGAHHASTHRGCACRLPRFQVERSRRAQDAPLPSFAQIGLHR